MMSRQLQGSEASPPDKQALASVLKYLEKQNLKVSGNWAEGFYALGWVNYQCLHGLWRDDLKLIHRPPFYRLLFSSGLG